MNNGDCIGGVFVHAVPGRPSTSKSLPPPSCSVEMTRRRYNRRHLCKEAAADRRASWTTWSGGRPRTKRRRGVALPAADRIVYQNRARVMIYRVSLRPISRRRVVVVENSVVSPLRCDDTRRRVFVVVVRRGVVVPVARVNHRIVLYRTTIIFLRERCVAAVYTGCDRTS